MLAMSSDSLYKFSVAIHAALAIGKSAMNKYYNKTDQSEVYHIAMGQVFFYSTFSFLPILISLVLHSCHKLEYFKKHNWEELWIQTAHEIVHEEFDRSYAEMDAGFDEGIMQVDSLNKETIHFFLLLPNFPSRPYIARQNPQPPLN